MSAQSIVDADVSVPAANMSCMRSFIMNKYNDAAGARFLTLTFEYEAQQVHTFNMGASLAKGSDTTMIEFHFI